MKYLINVKENYGQKGDAYIVVTPGGRTLILPVSQTRFYNGRAIIPLWLAEKMSGKFRRAAIDKYFK